jgi:hypothetical protein
MDIDGGNFSGFDGGGFTPTGIYKNNFSLNYTFLYKTGNIHYLYGQNSIDATVDVVSGTKYPFYYVYPSWSINVNNNDLNLVNYFTTGTNAQSFLAVSGVFYATKMESFNIGASGLNGGSPIYSPNITPYVTSPYSFSQDVQTIKDCTYHPTDFNPSQHFLLVYNSNSADSISLKNYYLSIRTGLTGINQLALTGFTRYLNGTTSGNDWITVENCNNQILYPIINWIYTNNKPIKYVILMYDIPFGLISGGNLGPPVSQILSKGFTISGSSLSLSTGNRNFLGINSTNYTAASSTYQDAIPISEYLNYSKAETFTLTKYLNTFICTHITAKNAIDVSGYIRKIGQGRVSGYYVLSPYISSTNLFLLLPQGATGTTGSANGVYGDFAQPFWDGMTGYPGMNVKIKLTGDWSPTIPQITGQNLAGFASYATHSINKVGQQALQQGYSINGAVIFSGNNWYIMTSMDSFDGQMNNPYTEQEYAWNWSTSGAFGGTGWEHCPIGQIATTVEPTIAGKGGHTYFTMWFSGYPFIECANAGIGPFHFAQGDPFVKLR